MTTNNEPNDKAVQAALKLSSPGGLSREEHVALINQLPVGKFTVAYAIQIMLAAAVRALDHKLEMAQRDAGVYCAANVLAARELGIDEDEPEPHMLEHQVRAIKKERDALQTDKERLEKELADSKLYCGCLENYADGYTLKSAATDYRDVKARTAAARAQVTKGET